MGVVNSWTGRTAKALQKALRQTNEEFAALLDVGVRTVASWQEKPDMELKQVTQQLLDTALSRSTPEQQARFAQLIGADSAPAIDEAAAADAEQRISTDPHIGAALEWLDTQAGWTPGTSRQRVTTQLAAVNIRELQDRGHRRGRIDQRQLADALLSYYGDLPAEHGPYAAQLDDVEVVTSILTRSTWLDLACPLTPQRDRLKLARTASTPNVDDLAAEHAVQRLAETLALGIRVVNAPLYELEDIAADLSTISGAVGTIPFVQYALTMDLLENEVTDLLANGEAAQPGALPLRDRYLPDAAALIDMPGRLCAGGALALTAIARPTGVHGPADYLLLVQERSGRVLNAARRLAVTPKGFHQPMSDYRADAAIRSTLMREAEEELFGREEIDNTTADLKSADPLHPSRLTEPMRWLTEQPDRMGMECTGFGLNLVSGNFEFAGLIVINDEDFWPRYGGHVEANWEAGGLRRYSTADRELITELITDVAWSNEGLFALLQGLRRLAEIDAARVNLPAIEWEIR